MTPKELKAFAAMCRKAGIKQYKCADFEIVLSEYIPEPVRRKKASKKQDQPGESYSVDTWDTLSDEEKLFYSSDVVGVAG